MKIADWIVVGEFLLALASLIVFTVGYISSTRGQALRSPEGRDMLNFRGSLATFMIMAIVHAFIHEYPGRDLVRILVIGWFALAAVQGSLLLYRAQRDHRRQRSAQQRSRERFSEPVRPDVTP